MEAPPLYSEAWWQAQWLMQEAAEAERHSERQVRCEAKLKAKQARVAKQQAGRKAEKEQLARMQPPTAANLAAHDTSTHPFHSNPSGASTTDSDLPSLQGPISSSASCTDEPLAPPPKTPPAPPTSMQPPPPRPRVSRSFEGLGSCVGLCSCHMAVECDELEGDEAAAAPEGKGGGGKLFSSQEVRVALEECSERATTAGMQVGAQVGAELMRLELQQKHEVEVVLEHLITRVEGEAVMEEAVAAVTAASVAAEKALSARIETLTKQMGGGNWLHAVGSAKRAASSAQGKADAAEKDQAKLKELMALQQIGPRMRTKGGELLSHLGSHDKAVAAGLLPKLAAPAPSRAAEVGLTEQWVDRLAAFLEEQLFFAGKGEVARTKLLTDALMKRPAMQRLLHRRDAHTERLSRAMTAMIDSAKGVLDHLTTGTRGSRSREDHMRFEAIVAALTPDDAKDLEMMRTIEELLGIGHRELIRALVCIAPTLPSHPSPLTSHLSPLTSHLSPLTSTCDQASSCRSVSTPSAKPLEQRRPSQASMRMVSRACAS